MGNRLTRINIDLGRYKQPWVDYCRAQRQTPSALCRQLVAQKIAGQATPEALGTDFGAKQRKQIMLSADERAHVAAHALLTGLSEGRWISALIQAHMQRRPQLAAPALQMLGQSNLALLAIGRNLNQLARVANASGTVAAQPLVQVLAALRVQLINHVDNVAQLTAAQTQYWRTS